MAAEDRPCVSVIIPACRRPALLKEAIESVLAQTFRDLELIVVDDDPALSAKAVAGGFQDPRLIYISHGSNRGGSAARNTGLMRARGRFVSFLDDDDLWLPVFLEKTVAAMSAAPAAVGVIYCPVEFINADGKRTLSRIGRDPRGNIHEAIFRGERSIVSTVALIRREVFDACGTFDEGLPSAQDWDLWIRASAKFEFDYVPEPLACVRVFGERISSDPARPIVSRERIFNKYAAELKGRPAARRVLARRLGKLNACAGRWGEAWRWFNEAGKESPIDQIKTVGWLLLRFPFIRRTKGGA